jgi:predicted RNase H-like HicB family nuclease
MNDRQLSRESMMHNEFTAVVERDGEWYIAYSPEIPGANGQGKTKQECLDSLADAIALILEDRQQEGLRGIPDDALQETVSLS